MVSDDQAVSFLGTYDQIMDFCAEIGQKMMSWTIVSGHAGWLGQRIQPTEKEVAGNGDGTSS